MEELWDNPKDTRENIIDKKITYTSKTTRRRRKKKSSSNDTNTVFINLKEETNNLAKNCRKLILLSLLLDLHELSENDKQKLKMWTMTITGDVLILHTYIPF